MLNNCLARSGRLSTNPLSERSDAYWNFFVSECLRQKAPLYARLSEGVREDPRLRAMTEAARPGQPIANLIFGAAHFLLLRGAEHELRRHYRTLTFEPPAKGDPYPLFRDFCLAHEAEIVRLIASRSVNTNEVGRAAYLHPAFLVVAQEAGAPLHVIELGCSAGLTLHWDRYGYRFLKDGAVLQSGAPEAAITLETSVTGGTPPLGPSPAVGQRVGLERDPVDLDNPDDRDWLKALVWPDHPLRLQRLERALAAVRGLPADIRKGDALTLLPDAMAESPPEGPVVILHAMVTYQFTEEAHRGLEDLLTVASVRRPVWRLSLEYADGVYPLRLSRYRDGLREDRTLALCDPQGGGMEWRG